MKRSEIHIISDAGERRVETTKDAGVIYVPLTAEEAKKLGITNPKPTLRVWIGPDDDRHQR